MFQHIINGHFTIVLKSRDILRDNKYIRAWLVLIPGGLGTVECDTYAVFAGSDKIFEGHILTASELYWKL